MTTKLFLKRVVLTLIFYPVVLWLVLELAHGIIWISHHV